MLTQRSTNVQPTAGAKPADSRASMPATLLAPTARASTGTAGSSRGSERVDTEARTTTIRGAKPQPFSNTDGLPSPRLAAIATGGVALGVGMVAGLLLMRVMTGRFFPQEIPLVLLVLGVVLTVALAVGFKAGWWIDRQAKRLRTLALRLEQLRDGVYERSTAGSDLGPLARFGEMIEAVAQNAAERERLIGQQAITDPLTGLPNRTLLSDRIRQRLAINQRTREEFCLLLVDLDRFKMVNDNLGHLVGDQVLREVARRLSRSVRECDTVARLGGDQFVLLLPGSSDMALEGAERIQDSLAKPLRQGEQLIDLAASIGIAAFPQHGEDEPTLIRRADRAMVQAKQHRDGILLFQGEDGDQNADQLSMLGDLRSALQANQLELYYQPKLDLNTGLIAGVEGLVRWQHPVRGRIGPDVFIPFAERSGLMREITRWVLEHGVAFGAELMQAKLHLRVSVNVTARDIEVPGFADLVKKLLLDAKLPADRLCLEITETGVVSESQSATATLKSLSEAGVHLSVDDFGTGYSTLKQLQQLPLNELKIDRSFIVGMSKSKVDQPIVQSTIALGRQLGLRVVAEGVEDLRQMRALQALGCHEIQGYYLARPMLGPELIEWVKMRHALHDSSQARVARR